MRAAAVLQARVRVACVLLTEPSRLNSQLKPLLATWARRCSSVFIVSSRPGGGSVRSLEGHALVAALQVSVRAVVAGRVEALEVHLEKERRNMLWPKV